MDLKQIIKSLLGLKKDVEGDGLDGYSVEQITKAVEKAREVFANAIEADDELAATESFEVVKQGEATLSARAAIAAERKSRLDQMATEIAPVTPDPEPEQVDPAAEPEKVEPVTAAAPEETPAVEPDPEPAKPKPSPAPASTEQFKILASADIQDVSPGQELTMAELGAAFVTKAEHVRTGKTGGKSSVGKIHLNLPEEYHLSSRSDVETNQAKINEAVYEAQRRTAENLKGILAAGRDEAQVMELTAAGGFCRPFPVRYDICQQGDDSRPLRDSLVNFALDRGGVTFIKPPLLSVVDGAVNIYTEEQDTTGYDYPKGCIRVDCPDNDEAVVQAITLCMEVGNFQRMAWPEIFQTWWTYGQILHARTAEEALWDKMVTLSTARTSPGSGLGALRSTLTEIERYAMQMRYQFRIPAETPLRMWMPEWLESVLRADLTNQQPGDNQVSVSDAQLLQYFANMNIAVSEIIDAQDPGSGDDPFPSTVQVILALEGTFMFGSMPTLDFGTEIRDFTQIRQNDVGAFMETFETVFAVCNGPQVITLPICPTGTSSAAVADLVTCST